MTENLNNTETRQIVFTVSPTEIMEIHGVFQDPVAANDFIKENTEPGKPMFILVVPSSMITNVNDRLKSLFAAFNN